MKFNSMQDHVRNLRAFLGKYEQKLSGTNFQVELGFRLAEFGDEKLRKGEVLSRIIETPASGSVGYKLTKSGSLLTTVAKCLSLNEFEHKPSHYNDELKKDIKFNLVPELEVYLNKLSSLNSSNIYEVSGLDDYPSFNIFWSFCYLIYDHNRGVGFLFWGGASD